MTKVIPTVPDCRTSSKRVEAGWHPLSSRPTAVTVLLLMLVQLLVILHPKSARADEYNHVVGSVHAFAGQVGVAGEADGPKQEATFYDIRAITDDGHDLYVAVHRDNGLATPTPNGGWIRRISMSTGEVTTLARMTTPFGLVHHDGYLYITDYFDGEIQRLSLSDGSLTTFKSGLDFPWGIATDGTYLYVTDGGCDGEGGIDRIAIADGTVSPVSKWNSPCQVSGVPEWLPGLVYAQGHLYGLDSRSLYDLDLASRERKILAQSTDQYIQYPLGLAFDDGVLYMTYSQNDAQEIWAVDPVTGSINTTFAGCDPSNGCNSQSGNSQPGIGVDARITPGSMHAFEGELYVSDRTNDRSVVGWNHHLIRRVTIIEDERPPTGSASASPVSDTSTPGTFSRETSGSSDLYQLRSLARDNASGVRWFQVTSGGQIGPWRTYSRNTTVAFTGRRPQIRFRDRAFNVSPWRNVSIECIRISEVHADSRGRDTSTNRSLNGEWLAVRNACSFSQRVSGWVVHDKDGNRYRFLQARLRPRATLKLHSGRGHNDGKHRFWGRRRYVWNNRTDVATLSNADGRMVDSFRYRR